MTIERRSGGACIAPFPVYADLAARLVSAHTGSAAQRDPVVAHTLGVCAGYAYADTETVATMLTRLGLDHPACVRITQIVDAMFIFSTAYLVQSRCGRVVILCYRGTETGNLGNWLGDADVGLEATSLTLASGVDRARVHAGFHRNFRATWWPIMGELATALEARSLLDHEVRLDHPLEALFVTGHSLGGAMAVLFGLNLYQSDRASAIAERLRAVYTFGQPMVVAGPLPVAAESLEPKLFRHLFPRDPVPALPPAPSGPFVHFGQEYRHVQGEWQRAQSPVVQISGVGDILRSGLALFAPQKRRAALPYSFPVHAPHHYISALRPPDRVSEFGD